MIKNKITESFLIIFLAVILLYIFSILNFKGLNGNLKKINLFSDIIKVSDAKLASASILNSSTTNKSFNDPNAKNDSIIRAKNAENASIIDYSNDSTGFEKIILALYNTKKNGTKTRIAYFGDSEIEGDMLTSDLRNLLQNVFGGKGVGFVPITSITADYRLTIRHTFSDNWNIFSFHNNKNLSHPLGLSGYVFDAFIKSDSTIPKENCSWVKYSSTSRSFKNLDKFYKIRLFYGKSDNENFIDYKAGNKEELKKLSGSDAVNEVILNRETPVENVKINFYCKSNVDIYGCSFESDSGVFVDNYSFRGNSGLPLISIPTNVIKGFDNLLNYNLVVLQYGLNVIDPTSTDYGWYEQRFTKTVNYIKQQFPNASILIIGVSDFSYKNENNEMETAPSVPIFIEVQKRIAKKNQVTFFNLYDAMGGYNSMKTLVESDPALANKDYKHFNFRGSNKIASLLYKQLMKEYYKHEKENLGSDQNK